MGTHQPPEDHPRDESVYHLFAVYVADRDAVRDALGVRGVGTGIHYPVPIHLQKAYAALGYERGAFPHTEAASDRVLSMPIYPELGVDQARWAASALAEIVGEAA